MKKTRYALIGSIVLTATLLGAACNLENDVDGPDGVNLTHAATGADTTVVVDSTHPPDSMVQLDGTSSPPDGTMEPDVSDQRDSDIVECDTCSQDIRVIAVIASDDDGNVPEFSVDDDYETRWSASGEGVWIQFTLSAQTTVSYIQIAFFRGDERRSLFDVQISTDGANWVDALTNQQSSGTSTTLETFSFDPVQALFVRLVGYGNDMEGAQEWNSYTEVRIEDFPIDLTCTPNQNQCGSDDCGGAHPVCVEGERCVGGVCQTVTNEFDIIFSQNFENSPLGDYLRTTWSQDWGIPVGNWSDPCYSNCADETEWAKALLTIEEEAGNRFMRHVLHTKGLSPGTSGVGWWKGLGNHTELYLSFRVRFTGPHWNGPTYDGKLPGFCGGGGCPGGGNPPLNYEGFSTRYMFKGTNSLFFYLYYAGMDTSSSNYGNSLHFSPYGNAPGQWRTVTQRVVLNSPGSANGIVEGFLDGVLVAQKTDMDFRDRDDQYIETLWFTNFLGGSGAEPSDNGDTPTVDFDDVVIYRYKDGAQGVVRDLQPHPPGSVILIPTP